MEGRGEEEKWVGGWELGSVGCVGSRAESTYVYPTRCTKVERERGKGVPMKVPRPFQWLFFWPMHLLASVTASPPRPPHTAVITNWLPPLDILLMLSPASLAPADRLPCTFITHAIYHAVRTQSFPSTTTRSIDAEELSRDRHHTSGGTIQLVQEEARVPCNLVDAVAFLTTLSTARAAAALAVAI